MESIYHSKSLPLSSGIVPFCHRQFSTSKCNGVIKRTLTWLCKYYAKRDRWCISMYMKLFLLIWKYQYRSWYHIVFENIQTLLTLLIPLEFNIFLQQLFHWSCNLTIPQDKFSVISCIPQGIYKLFKWNGWGYLDDHFNLGKVHQYSFLIDHMIQ